MEVGDLKVHYKCSSCGEITQSTRFNVKLPITGLGSVLGAQCLSCKSQKLVAIEFECDILQTVKYQYTIKCDLCGCHWVETCEVTDRADLIQQRTELEAACFCANHHCPSTSFTMVGYGIVD